MKYNNKITVIDNISFDSKLESQCYIILKNLQKQEKISNLKLQVKYELLPSFEYQNEKIRGINYYSDFEFDCNGIHYVIDVKGFKTKDYLLKAKMLKNLIKNDKNVIFYEIKYITEIRGLI